MAKRSSNQKKISFVPGMIFPINRQRTCYSHFTTATDTNNIKRVFNSVHHMILSFNLSEIGLQ